MVLLNEMTLLINAARIDPLLRDAALMVERRLLAAERVVVAARILRDHIEVEDDAAWGDVAALDDLDKALAGYVAVWPWMGYEGVTS